MDKRTNKKPKYHELIIERLITKYGVSGRFIRMSLNGDRESETSESLKKDYPLMLRAISELLKKL